MQEEDSLQEVRHGVIQIRCQMNGAGGARALQINNLEKCHRGPRFELGLKADGGSGGERGEKGHSGECPRTILRGAMLDPFHCSGDATCR